MAWSKGITWRPKPSTRGLCSKPVNVVERQKAGQALSHLLARVHTQQPASTRSPHAQEEGIAQEVKALRQDTRAIRHA